MPLVKAAEIDDVPVWYVEDATLPVVHLVLTFTGAGNASDPADQPGRAVMAANVLGEGAGEMNALAFHTALESKAIELSISAGRDDVVVQIHTLKEALPEAMRLARLALTKPRFDAEAMSVAKSEQLAVLRMQDESPSAIASRAWNATFYGAHPYARDGLGSEKSIARLGAGDLESYRQRYLTRANLQVAAAGDVDRSALRDALAPLLDALPEAFFPELDLPGVTFGGAGKVERITHAGPQSVVVFGAPGVARDDKRYYAYYLMNEALGGGSLSSRLMRDVRVKHGLVYSVGTNFSHGDAANSFSGRFATRNDSVDAAIAAVKKSASSLAEKGLSQRECKEIKQEVIGGFALKLDSTRKLASIVAMMLRYDLGRDYMRKREEYFDAVSCGDIQEAAKKLLRPEAWFFTVVGGEGS